MPVYNEAGSVVLAVGRLLQSDLGVPYELIVVDDGSTDGTSDLLAERSGESPRMRVIHHPVNLGKGAAIRTALEHAGGRYACIYDADLECDPADIAAILAPVRDGRAEVVYGVRDLTTRTGQTRRYVLGNRLVTVWCNLLFGSGIRDVMTCYKLMPLELFRSLGIEANGFEVEPEITGKLLARGYAIHQVPVSYRPRTHDMGKKLRASDGWGVVTTLLRIKLRERRPPTGERLARSRLRGRERQRSS